MSGFLAALFVASVIAGATAGIAGFGIGSLLTPLIAVRLGTPAAIAIVAIPHFAATALRGWRLRQAVDWPVFRRFGVWSAIGGLAGALLFTRVGGPVLTTILGGLLVLTAVSSLSGWSERVRLPAWGAWILGILSGFFGGVVGTQGGLRAGALLGIGLTPAAFVATSTLSGIVIDVVRTPLYLWRAGETLAANASLVVIATGGALIGTLLGERLLAGLSPRTFRQAVSLLVGALGVWLLIRAA